MPFSFIFTRVLRGGQKALKFEMNAQSERGLVSSSLFFDAPAENLVKYSELAPPRGERNERGESRLPELVQNENCQR